MIYPFTLQLTGIVVGILLIALHGLALAAPGPTQSFLRALPRSREWGIGLLVGSAVWAFWLVRTMDLGEFQPLRFTLTIAVPAGALLTVMFVDEFLAVRALGIVALLAAEPLLDAAYLRPEVSRLLLVCLAYVWIIAGLFLVGMPYILRDLTTWLLRQQSHYRAAAIAGFVCGIAILACAITLW
ncbi:MAG: hypothetical protein ACREKL_04920 [Chthoniobacterales bacterium]